MDKHLAQAYQAGIWCRERGGQITDCPVYAPNELGRPLRQKWVAGYMSLGPLTETKRKGNK